MVWETLFCFKRLQKIFMFLIPWKYVYFLCINHCTYKEFIFDDGIGQHLNGLRHGSAGAIRVLLLLELPAQGGGIAEAMKQFVPLSDRQRTGRRTGVTQQRSVAIRRGYGASISVEILRLILRRSSECAIRVDFLYEIVLGLGIFTGQMRYRIRFGTQLRLGWRRWRWILHQGHPTGGGAGYGGRMGGGGGVTAITNSATIAIVFLFPERKFKFNLLEFSMYVLLDNNRTKYVLSTKHNVNLPITPPLHRWTKEEVGRQGYKVTPLGISIRSLMIHAQLGRHLPGSTGSENGHGNPLWSETSIRAIPIPIHMTLQWRCGGRSIRFQGAIRMILVLQGHITAQLIVIIIIIIRGTLGHRIAGIVELRHCRIVFLMSLFVWLFVCTHI